ncbi:glycosyltransferase family 2 protein [Janthinobacterium sp. HH104]|uniref:glycosyltransferase family 2 protein n=1 Tax=Janthinobacterium sp. HH104 TaxID=1537276 RepID=UPI000874A19F|nr:glycosyltransferase family 2 protein [Janthinobacterium sp. HH104]
MPKISVCMAVYNGEKYILEQIESILGQLSADDELIVSDDGSTDLTLEKIRSCGDARIRMIANELDKGYSGNFEHAIRHATGEVIFLSDQDDVWLAGRVQKMLAALERCDMVVCNAQFTDDVLTPLDTTLFSLRGGGQGFWKNLFKSRYLGACMAFKRSILRKALPFPGNRKLCPHDLWLTLVAELYYRVELIEEPLILYRRHGANVSSGGSASTNSFFNKMQFRAYCLLKVLGRA